MSERFTLLSELGRGGMGVVWKARDEETGQIVALKVMRETYAEDPDYVTRFERELELSRRINSNHVVRVIGYGVRERLPYLALEYVDGPSLYQLRASHGPYSWADARALLIQIAQGISDAHAAGIIHRDVKPSNVLIGTDGVAKLTDFGIARGLDLERMTATSTMLGTPIYLAPEGPVDTRSDLYSLGIIGYELLAGAPPFGGSTYQQIILAHVRTPPDLEKLPSDSRPIIGWLLAKDAEERPQNGQELLAVLRGRLMLPGTVVPSIALTAPAAPLLPIASAARPPGAQPPGSDGALDPWAYYGDEGPRINRPPSSFRLRDAGSFFRGGRMTVPRVRHASTLMADGRVLLTGGWDGVGAIWAAEAFDPVSGNMSGAGTALVARMRHSATLLPDGCVLVAGGSDSHAAIRSAEIFDPATSSFSATADMKYARQGHTATRLADGRVLVVGGYSHRPSASIEEIEIFDPGKKSFAPVGRLLNARIGHSATLMSDGRVLITGGGGNETVGDAAEVYDPAREESFYVGRLMQPRRSHTSVLLADGRVLIAGGRLIARGRGEPPIASVEIYAPQTVSFSAIEPLLEPRSDHTATVLPDGRVLIVGGSGNERSTRSTELFDPDSNSFAQDASMTTAREGHTATLLPKGRVLIVGGQGQSGVLGSTEVFSQ
jgi:serine/threonine protein kinase